MSVAAVGANRGSVVSYLYQFDGGTCVCVEDVRVVGPSVEVSKAVCYNGQFYGRVCTFPVTYKLISDKIT